MYIKSIVNNSVDRFGRVSKTTIEYGKYKGYNIAIEKNSYKDKVFSKQFVVWNNVMQMIVNKVRHSCNEKFKRIG